MDYQLGFLGQYITAAELIGKTPTLTIQRITLEKVESLKLTDDDAGGKLRDRIVIYFAEGRSGRGWLLNRTNAECLKEMFGRETDQWLGKRVTLFVTQVRVGPKMEPGIRVKGSPDIIDTMRIEVKLPRRKPVPMTLTNTPTAPTEQPAAASPAPSATKARPKAARDPDAAASVYVPFSVIDALAAVGDGRYDDARDMGRSLGPDALAMVETEIAARG